MNFFRSLFSYIGGFFANILKVWARKSAEGLSVVSPPPPPPWWFDMPKSNLYCGDETSTEESSFDEIVPPDSQQFHNCLQPLRLKVTADLEKGIRKVHFDNHPQFSSESEESTLTRLSHQNIDILKEGSCSGNRQTKNFESFSEMKVDVLEQLQKWDQIIDGDSKKTKVSPIAFQPIQISSNLSLCESNKNQIEEEMPEKEETNNPFYVHRFSLLDKSEISAEKLTCISLKRVNEPEGLPKNEQDTILDAKNYGDAQISTKLSNLPQVINVRHLCYENKSIQTENDNNIPEKIKPNHAPQLLRPDDPLDIFPIISQMTESSDEMQELLEKCLMKDTGIMKVEALSTNAELSKEYENDNDLNELQTAIELISGPKEDTKSPERLQNLMKENLMKDTEIVKVEALSTNAELSEESEKYDNDLNELQSAIELISGPNEDSKSPEELQNLVEENLMKDTEIVKVEVLPTDELTEESEGSDDDGDLSEFRTVIELINVPKELKALPEQQFQLKIRENEEAKTASVPKVQILEELQRFSLLFEKSQVEIKGLLSTLQETEVLSEHYSSVLISVIKYLINVIKEDICLSEINKMENEVGNMVSHFCDLKLTLVEKYDSLIEKPRQSQQIKILQAIQEKLSGELQNVNYILDGSQMITGKLTDTSNEIERVTNQHFFLLSDDKQGEIEGFLEKITENLSVQLQIFNDLFNDSQTVLELSKMSQEIEAVSEKVTFLINTQEVGNVLEMKTELLQRLQQFHRFLDAFQSITVKLDNTSNDIEICLGLLTLLISKSKKYKNEGTLEVELKSNLVKALRMFSEILDTSPKIMGFTSISSEIENFLQQYPSFINEHKEIAENKHLEEIQANFLREMKLFGKFLDSVAMMTIKLSNISLDLGALLELRSSKENESLEMNVKSNPLKGSDISRTSKYNSQSSIRLDKISDGQKRSTLNACEAREMEVVANFLSLSLNISERLQDSVRDATELTQEISKRINELEEENNNLVSLFEMIKANTFETGQNSLVSNASTGTTCVIKLNEACEEGTHISGHHNFYGLSGSISEIELNQPFKYITENFQQLPYTVNKTKETEIMECLSLDGKADQSKDLQISCKFLDATEENMEFSFKFQEIETLIERIPLFLDEDKQFGDNLSEETKANYFEDSKSIIELDESQPTIQLPSEKLKILPEECPFYFNKIENMEEFTGETQATIAFFKKTCNDSMTSTEVTKRFQNILTSRGLKFIGDKSSEHKDKNGISKKMGSNFFEQSQKIDRLFEKSQTVIGLDDISKEIKTLLNQSHQSRDERFSSLYLSQQSSNEPFGESRSEPIISDPVSILVRSRVGSEYPKKNVNFSPEVINKSSSISLHSAEENVDLCVQNLEGNHKVEDFILCQDCLLDIGPMWSSLPELESFVFGESVLNSPENNSFCASDTEDGEGPSKCICPFCDLNEEN